MPQKPDYLKEAIKHLQIADHMAYVTFPLINDNRLILKIFEEIYKSITNCIDFIIANKIIFKEEPSNEKKAELFFENYAKTINLNDIQIKKIQEIIETYKKHKQSAMEFARSNKIVILSDSLKTQALNINKIKEYLLFAKELLKKII